MSRSAGRFVRKGITSAPSFKGGDGALFLSASGRMIPENHFWQFGQ